MFYVCSKRGDLYGIVDTDDGICEFYSERQIKNFIRKGVDIIGVSENEISIVDSDFIRAKAKILGIEVCNYTLDRNSVYRIGRKGSNLYLVSSSGAEIIISGREMGYISNIVEKLKIENLWSNKYFNMSLDTKDVYIKSLNDFIEPLLGNINFHKSTMESKFNVTPVLKSIYRRGTTLIIGVTLGTEVTQYFSISSNFYGFFKRCSITDNCKLYKRII